MSALEEIFRQLGPNSGYVEELYRLYQTDPSLVGEQWSNYFSSLDPATTTRVNVPYTNGTHKEVAPANQSTQPGSSSALQERITALIAAFRSWGHFHARVNPLSNGVKPLPKIPDLDVSSDSFSAQELAQSVCSSGFMGTQEMSVGSILEQLSSIYCGSIGFEYTHLLEQQERRWLQERIESRLLSPPLPPSRKKRLLERLVEGEGLEVELHKTYVGAKRFSLQGAETTLAMLDCVLERGSELAVRNVFIGMAHRGRLNVLTHICGKPYENLCSEFDDQSAASVLGAGDVKYHLGYAGYHRALNGQDLRVELAPNPSHLEFVNPVVEGMVRALQDLSYAKMRPQVLPVLIHGDAAFIGQGVVWETLNMSGVDGYRTGGTLHIVINNQVGFTTDPEESRSSAYCTEMAKAIQAPIFHVNGDDVEACCWATELALEFRQVFGRDVVVDLYCYRKFGHNEGDDPTVTQPLMYTELQTKQSVATIYADKLVHEGVIAEGELLSMQTEHAQRFQAARSAKKPQALGEACPVYGKLRAFPASTGVHAETLQRIGRTLVEYPEGFVPHPKLAKILAKRVETLTTGKGIDWGFAEGLAFGSLVTEGVGVRLTGQDAGRGTFSQRHLLLTHGEKRGRYYPFDQLSPDGLARFEVYNSVLSEASVMGFEFGYAAVATKRLVIWEAQFGDFANGAQVIIDQFLASSEAKWNQLSGLVLLLPHGFEGQGPEHSSARLERYLQLCAEGNMTVAHPSSAAQQFHLLRRQALSEIKRPLVIMTPKSLLRLPEAACALTDLCEGKFHRVIAEDFGKGKAKHVVLCSGKVYYDIAKALNDNKTAGVKLIRIEELYPFPKNDVARSLGDSPLSSCIWVQEEPQNMGAWSFIAPLLERECGLKPQYVGRAASASPATGSGKRSAAELKAFLQDLLERVQ